MRAATCFSGIGAPECALPEWDWRWSADIEPFPNAVRAERFPAVPNLGDVLDETFLDRAAALDPVDVLIGGPPCQDFSVAGLREGLHGARGNLSLRWVQIIHAIRPRYAVTENVPGWFSVNKGHAFGAFLAGLVGFDTAIVPPREAGGKWTRAGMVAGPSGRAAWRVLDAQYFGLAQRRERVFVVSCLGDGGDPAAVLFEPARVRGNYPPRRETGERVARPIAAGSPGGSGYRNDADTADSLVAGTLNANGKAAGAEVQAVAYGGNNTAGPIDVATALNASHTASGRQDFETETFIAHTLRAEGFDASEDGTGRGVPLVAASLTSGKGNGSRPAGRWQEDDTNLVAFAHHSAAVRRLTPREAEKLQGFPPDFTLIPYRNGMSKDGPRYRALGNSMAVPCMAWIGRRIAAQHSTEPQEDTPHGP